MKTIRSLRSVLSSLLSSAQRRRGPRPKGAAIAAAAAGVLLLGGATAEATITITGIVAPDQITLTHDQGFSVSYISYGMDGGSISLYLSKDALYSKDDIKVGKTSASGSLFAEKKKSGDWFDMPIDFPTGAYRYIAVAKFKQNGKTVKSWMAGGTVGVKVPDADLAAISIEGPPTYSAGMNASFDIDVADVGEFFWNTGSLSFYWTTYRYEIRLAHDGDQTGTLMAIGKLTSFGKKTLNVSNLPASDVTGSWKWRLSVSIDQPWDVNPGNDSVLGNGYQAPPEWNVEATKIAGPQSAKIGDKVVVSYGLKNEGDLTLDEYQVEIYLSKGSSKKAVDTLVKVFGHSAPIAKKVKVTLPSTMSTGLHTWKLIVRGKHIKAKTWTDSDELTGGAILVFPAPGGGGGNEEEDEDEDEDEEDDPPPPPPTPADLSLVNTSYSITLPAGLGDETTFSVWVKNLGEQTLSWSSYGFPSWMTPNAPSGTVEGGFKKNVVFTLNGAGLAPGTYFADPVFFNLNGSSDMESLSLAFIIPENPFPVFLPGDELEGDLGGGVRYARFFAVPGMTLKINVDDLDEDERLRVGPVESIGVPLAPAVTLDEDDDKTSFTFDEAGYVMLMVQPISGSGSFELRTKAKFSDDAECFKAKLSGSDGATQVIEIPAIAGTEIIVKAKPTSSYTGTGIGVTLTFDEPEYDASVEPCGELGMKVPETALPHTGAYELRITGVAGENGVKVKVEFDHPKGDATIQL